MKLKLLLLAAAVSLTSLDANEPIVVSELPVFKTAKEWAADLKLRHPSFTLVHSSETKRMWLVLFRTVENNLVWCQKQVEEFGGARGIRKIHNMNGKSIIISNYDPVIDREQPAQGLNFRTEFKIAHEKGWDIYSRDDGILIALAQPPPKAFRIQYTLRPNDGSEPVVLDEMIDFVDE